MPTSNPPVPARCTEDRRGLRVRSDVLRLHAMPLEHGHVLEDVNVGYTFYGEPGRPVVVVLGGISAGRRVHDPLATARRGWWQEVVGMGRAIDTRKVAVLGLDFLGGAGASTGAQGPGFPSISTFDQARALALVLDHLGVARADAVVGSSYGGMVALAFADRFGHRLKRLAVISAAHESHPMATALRTLQRRVVWLGREAGRMEAGLAIARGIAMTTYRTAEEFAARFPAAPEPGPRDFRFPVEEYLDHHGASFARRFSPWSFLCLSESLDLHRVDPARISTPVALLSVDSDTLVPPWQMRVLAERLGGPVRSTEVSSIYGHDAFLKEMGAVSDFIRSTLCAGADL